MVIIIEIKLKDGRIIKFSEYDIKQLYFNLFILRKYCLNVEDFIEVYKKISELDSREALSVERLTPTL